MLRVDSFHSTSQAVGMCSAKDAEVYCMLGVRRQPDEDWVHFVKRATHASESAFRSHGCESWLALYICRRWQFPSKLISRGDSRWTLRLLHWQPWHFCLPHRGVGRPRQRWTDVFVEHCGDSWESAAASDPLLWSMMCEMNVLKNSQTNVDDDAAPY